MTGFGAGRGEAGGEALTVELRAVNGKFCEVKPRLPRELSALEPELVKSVKARVSRGAIDVFVRRESTSTRGMSPKVDLALAAAYAKALRELKNELGLAGEPAVNDIAALDGVISLGETAADPAAAASALQTALGAALDALEQMRRREGEALARDLLARLAVIEQGAREVGRLSPLQVPGAIFSISYTTRKPRGAEKERVDYHFVDEERFQEMIADGAFVEWAQVHGHHYGTPRTVIAEAEARGALAIFDIDVQGGESIKKQH